MWSILSILLFIILGILLLIGLVFALFYGLSQAFQPLTPEQQLKEFGHNLMGYDFGDGYEVIDLKSQNSHPDRPQDLKIKLNDEEYAKLKAYIDTLEEGEKKVTKKGTIYSDSIKKNDNGCCFYHTSSHANCDYTFFSASAVVDYKTKEVSFSSTFY